MSPLPGYDAAGVTINHVVGSTVDGEGRTTLTYGPNVTVDAAAGMPTAQQLLVAAANGEALDVVVRVRSGTVVSPGDKVTIPAKKGRPLAGSYRVTTVKWNALDVRVFGERLATT